MALTAKEQLDAALGEAAAQAIASRRLFEEICGGNSQKMEEANNRVAELLQIKQSCGEIERKNQQIMDRVLAICNQKKDLEVEIQRQESLLIDLKRQEIASDVQKLSFYLQSVGGMKAVYGWISSCTSELTPSQLERCKASLLERERDYLRASVTVKQTAGSFSLSVSADFDPSVITDSPVYQYIFGLIEDFLVSQAKVSVSQLTSTGFQLSNESAGPLDSVFQFLKETFRLQWMDAYFPDADVLSYYDLLSFVSPDYSAAPVNSKQLEIFGMIQNYLYNQESSAVVQWPRDPVEADSCILEVVGSLKSKSFDYAALHELCRAKSFSVWDNFSNFLVRASQVLSDDSIEIFCTAVGDWARSFRVTDAKSACLLFNQVQAFLQLLLHSKAVKKSHLPMLCCLHEISTSSVLSFMPPHIEVSSKMEDQSELFIDTLLQSMNPEFAGFFISQLLLAISEFSISSLFSKQEVASSLRASFQRRVTWLISKEAFLTEPAVKVLCEIHQVLTVPIEDLSGCSFCSLVPAQIAKLVMAVHPQSAERKALLDALSKQSSK